MKLKKFECEYSRYRAQQRRSDERGMALLMTLTIITVLVALALELNREARSMVISMATTRDRFTLSYMASSGVHAAMAMLIKDKKDSPYDSLQEDWANPEKISEVLSALPFEKGSVTFKIFDELARIQVNSLVKFPEGRHFNESQKIMWDRLLRTLAAASNSKNDDQKIKDENVTEIINSVKDWLDSGDDDAITGLNGAESDYYNSLNPPYSAKNGPFTDLRELMLVKGIKPEYYSGVGDIPGFSKYMTVYGMTKTTSKVNKRNYVFEGKININTADLPVLMAVVPSENPEYAQNIYDYRMEKEDGKFIHDLSNPSWYKNAPGCNEITIDPNLITISSDCFRIESTATLNEIKLTITAVVQREKNTKTGKWNCRILNWQTG